MRRPALAYWAIAMANRSLPAATTSLALLTAPVVGTFSSAAIPGELLTATLLAATTRIVGGIAVGTITR